MSDDEATKKGLFIAAVCLLSVILVLLLYVLFRYILKPCIEHLEGMVQYYNSTYTTEQHQETGIAIPSRTDDEVSFRPPKGTGEDVVI